MGMALVPTGLLCGRCGGQYPHRRCRLCFNAEWPPVSTGAM